MDIISARELRHIAAAPAARGRGAAGPPFREARHIARVLAAATAVAAAALLAACAGGVSNHAPGVGGVQTQDPGALNFPLAYVKRPAPGGAGNNTDVSALDLITSTAGGDLYVRQQASAGSPEVNVTGTITKGKGDVRDLDASPDGKKLVFSLRLPLDPGKANTDPSQPTWKIYEYDAGTQAVTQLTSDDTAAGHDIGAHFLPDGRIVFASTRQAGTQALLIDEGRPQYPAQSDLPPRQPIFLLHVMNADGTDIHQISFNTDHDFAPSVMSDGRVVFSRAETTNGGQISLYRTRPDGTELELLYGANSHATGPNVAGSNDNVIQFLGARQRADGKLIAIVRPMQGTQQGGDIVAIDSAAYVEISQPSAPGGGTGPGQVSATTAGVTTDAGKPSIGGRFYSAYPLYDGTNRMLVSWAPCLIVDASGATKVCTPSNITDATLKEAPPQYTLWTYDVGTGTLSPLLAAESGKIIVEPVIMQSRSPAPTFIPDFVPTGAAADLAGNTNGGIGVLEIKSVYDFDGVDEVAAETNGLLPDIAALADPRQASADQRPARFVRVEKAVEIPDNKVRRINASAFGPAGMGMREILAYAPVEPDGSVKIQIPANVPFTIDVLDKYARRIGPRHTSWLQLMPGETKTCNGCHTAGGAKAPSHGRAGLTASVNPGAATAGQPFPDTLAALAAPVAGDTMAEARVYHTCTSVRAAGCSEIPSIDVIYTDVWTDPAKAGRPADASFAYLYSNLTTPAPANAHCATWDPLCRSTIHYPLHLQPVWSFVRQVKTGGVVTSDNTCVLCHNPVNAAGTVQVPAGQLDLTNSTSSVDASVTTSYEQLLFQHNEQTLNMGVLQDLLVPGPGGTMVPQPLGPPMVAGSAIASEAQFFRMFDGTYHDANVDHTGFLTPAELRLIAEWLDIGAQYYNDPFVAPAAN